MLNHNHLREITTKLAFFLRGKGVSCHLLKGTIVPSKTPNKCSIVLSQKKTANYRLLTLEVA